MVDCNRVVDAPQVVPWHQTVQAHGVRAFSGWDRCGTRTVRRERPAGARILVKMAFAVSRKQIPGRSSMSTGWRLNTITGVLLLCLGVPCFGDDNPVSVTSPQSQQKTKKKTKKAQKPQLPPLPSGPTGPVQPIPMDSMAPVPPQVSYQNAQLTIVAPNSTLGDILRAVRKQTGAEIEIPAAPERVVTHLGPGP